MRVFSQQKSCNDKGNTGLSLNCNSIGIREKSKPIELCNPAFDGFAYEYYTYLLYL